LTRAFLDHSRCKATVFLNAKETVAAAHGDGAHSDHVDPATELASPADVVDVALDAHERSEGGVRPECFGWMSGLQPETDPMWAECVVPVS
jgi:hypothetical protein